MSSVEATSAAGCCTAFINPLSTLSAYRWPTRSVPVKYSAITAAVPAAATLSHTSIVRRLSHRSLSAPAKTLSATYGAYEQIESIAVLSADPVSR